MLDPVAYEYRQVAQNLGLKPEVILAAVSHGLLPATKVSKTDILVADRDLIILLKRYSDCKALNNSPDDPAWQKAEELIDQQSPTSPAVSAWKGRLKKGTRTKAHGRSVRVIPSLIVRQKIGWDRREYQRI